MCPTPAGDRVNRTKAQCVPRRDSAVAVSVGGGSRKGEANMGQWIDELRQEMSSALSVAHGWSEATNDRPGRSTDDASRQTPRAHRPSE